MSTASTPPSDDSLAVRANRWTLHFSLHWLRYLLIGIGLYAFLPFTAPVLMHFRLNGPANVIYTMYSPLCHQFAFRSWFFFGEQPVYPRQEAGVPGLTPYEAYADQINAATKQNVDLTQWTLDFQLVSKSFIGNDQMGYKVAICERDVAIYLALFLFGLIFSFKGVRRYLRPMPIWLYVLLGVMPIAIDGFSQLFGNPPFGWLPVRESTPLFRTVTGAMFGFSNGWLAFPYLEESAHQTIQEINAKFARREKRLSTQG